MQPIPSHFIPPFVTSNNYLSSIPVCVCVCVCVCVRECTFRLVDSILCYGVVWLFAFFLLIMSRMTTVSSGVLHLQADELDHIHRKVNIVCLYKIQQVCANKVEHGKTIWSPHQMAVLVVKTNTDLGLPEYRRLPQTRL